MRSRTSSFSQDTDYIILQSNPLLRWVPTPDEPDSTDDSSIESLTLHPIHRTNSQRSITSRCSIKSSCSVNQKIPSKHKTSSRPTSLLISPTASPLPIRLAKSIDDNFTDENKVQQKGRKTSITKTRRSSSSVGEEISIPVPVTSAKSKFGRLKEKLLSSKSQPTEQQVTTGEAESDGESTPLVSELSTPTHSNSFDQTPSSPDYNTFSPSSNASGLHNYSKIVGEEHIIDVDCSDSMVLSSQESSSGRSLSRQDAKDWENPETPV